MADPSPPSDTAMPSPTSPEVMLEKASASGRIDANGEPQGTNDGSMGNTGHDVAPGDTQQKPPVVRS